MRARGFLPAMAAAAALLGAAGATRADVTASSTFGFDGSSVPGCVTPVRVELSSSEKTPIRCRVEVAAARGMAGVSTEGIVYASEVFLAPGAKKRLTIPVLPRAMSNGEWNLTLRTDRRTLIRHGTAWADARALTVPVGSGGPMATATRDLEAAPPIVGLLGDPTLRCAWLGDATRHEEGAKKRLRNVGGVTVLDSPLAPSAALPQFASVAPEAAPDSWICYEGMDALLWVDPDPDSLKDAAQLEAVLEYAACGGRLVVALTPGAKLGAASPLAAALPALATGHDDMSAELVLAAAAGGSGNGAGQALVPVARLGEARGTVLARLPDGRPLLVSRSYGLGTVVVAAFDPRLLSGASTADHALLLHALFGSVVEVPDSNEEASSAGAGLEPLVNHLRKRFLTSPPLGLLVLGLALYVAAIGPVDYFLLKRKGKLRRTVITFPLIVISFTLLAYGASFLLFGGSSGQARVAWLDFATAPAGNADVVRGMDFTGAYSPTGTTLSFAYDQPRSFVAAPWLAEGYAFGSGDAGSLDGTVEIGPDGRPVGAFDLPLRSHRTVEARFSGEVPLALDAVMKSAGGRQVLSVRNGLRLPVNDLCVVRGGRVLVAGGLAAGATVEVDLGKGPWVQPGRSTVLPHPFQQGGGFFGQGGGTQFVPADDTDAANAEAREAMGRAAMGASLAGLSGSGPSGQARVLARRGLDLSRQAREGRILVMGWCEGDPLGGLPAWKAMRSAAVVVRRVLPAEEGK